MKKVDPSGRIPIKMWLDDLEEGALDQAKNLSNLPFAFKHIALMPDSHQGYGMPIGGVLATKGVVVPNAVGVDIGCGMLAQRTNIPFTKENRIEHEVLEKIVNLIKKRVPVGFFWNKDQQDPNLMPKIEDDLLICGEKYNDALYQLGTLGGGNHFIEIQAGNDGYLWIMIHSGSRNLGKTVADFYNGIALEENQRWYSNNIHKDLAFLPLSSSFGRAYLKEMQYCVDFALANRTHMLNRIVGAFSEVLKKNVIEDIQPINIAHNYARMENHFGQNVMVHRKGATSAKAGEVGIIPGSQGTKSYIVEGLGNPDSFTSCSHGAGRKMGRAEAKRSLDLQNQIDLMNSQGIIHDISSVDSLDEAPGAYKDIDIVMENQKDLVKILVELSPIAVIKG